MSTLQGRRHKKAVCPWASIMQGPPRRVPERMGSLM
jgi:hypothetical protein